ncbi:MAG: hypothetical protein NZ480_02125 [Bdellovibrionaceae bacterium]|nr:hypothetical protein [Pseudobdellovibrionaceae bacterium]MDW8189666.1 hypothetical protein [Pseudobdellovibrionaceae bacterium]
MSLIRTVPLCRTMTIWNVRGLILFLVSFLSISNSHGVQTRYCPERFTISGVISHGPRVDVSSMLNEALKKKEWFLDKNSIDTLEAQLNNHVQRVQTMYREQQEIKANFGLKSRDTKQHLCNYAEIIEEKNEKEKNKKFKLSAQLYTMDASLDRRDRKPDSRVFLRINLSGDWSWLQWDEEWTAPNIMPPLIVYIGISDYGPRLLTGRDLRKQAYLEPYIGVNSYINFPIRNFDAKMRIKHLSAIP